MGGIDFLECLAPQRFHVDICSNLAYGRLIFNYAHLPFGSMRKIAMSHCPPSEYIPSVACQNFPPADGDRVGRVADEARRGAQPLSNCRGVNFRRQSVAEWTLRTAECFVA